MNDASIKTATMIAHQISKQTPFTARIEKLANSDIVNVFDKDVLIGSFFMLPYMDGTIEVRGQSTSVDPDYMNLIRNIVEQYNFRGVYGGN